MLWVSDQEGYKLSCEQSVSAVEYSMEYSVRY